MLTDNPIVTDVAWQKTIRDKYLHEGVPDVPTLDLRSSIVKIVDSSLAKEIILKYEWLGTMASTNWHYGIFFGDYCAGVCCVAVGGGAAGINVHRWMGVERHELGVLSRGACVHWAPPNTNSRLVSQVCRLIKKDAGVKVLVAYSDTNAGEIGTIYQACNWTYVGKGESTKQWVSPNGRIYDKKIVHNLRVKNKTLDTLTWREQRDILFEEGWTRQNSNPKHRYVQVLDRSDKHLLARVAELKKEYPKRSCVESIDSDAISFQK